MNDNGVENAKITGTSLGPEDHGIFTANIQLGGAGWGQGFGNYNLRYANHAYLFVDGVLRALGVEKWEDLPGVVCRVRREAGIITAIGHVLDDRWFQPRVTLLDPAS